MDEPGGESVREFLSQGGYGAFVWGAYGTAAVLMALEVILIRRRRGTIVARIRRWIRLHKPGD